MHSNHTPVLSIITSSLNDAENLKKSINSMRHLLDKNVEWIIVDGNSSDNTFEVLKKNSDLFSHIIIESDQGIYDAWNKGIKKARGEWVCFLGAGDLLLEDYFSEVLKFLVSNPNHTNLIYSLVEVVDTHRRLLKILGRKPFDHIKFQKSMTIPHVGTCHRVKLFEDFGFFDATFKSSGDYEFLLRCGNELKPFLLNKVAVRMLYGGTSESMLGLRETLMIHKKYLNPLNAYVNFIIAATKLGIRKFVY